LVVTRSLLGHLALAGPFYVIVSLAQAVTRTRFDLARDEWSLLAVGHAGWIQMANLAVTGAMTIAGAIGVRRAIGRDAVSGLWAPRLLAGYGAALIAAGVFTADPADGFPAGTAAGPDRHPSLHATLHIVSGSIGFACLIAACFVVARGLSSRGLHRRASASRVIGGVFAVAFLGIASGSTSVAVNLAFTGAVIVVFAWLTMLAVHLYRRVEVDAADGCGPQRGRHVDGAARAGDDLPDRDRPTGSRGRAEQRFVSYAIYQVASKEEAVEWTSRFLRVHAEHWPGYEGQITVLKVFGPEDFGPPA
jgi:uncharacterized membrane protein YozB (DUF420 family)